jgi:outer membrane protein TolC
VDADVGATRTRLSRNSISLGGLDLGGANSSGTTSTSGTSSSSVPPLGLPGTEFNTFQLGFDMSWELDLFGKARRTAEAATADTEVLVWSLRDTWVSLAAEIAETYFQLRAAQQRVAVRLAQTTRERREVELIRAKVASRACHVTRRAAGTVSAGIERISAAAAASGSSGPYACARRSSRTNSGESRGGNGRGGTAPGRAACHSGRPSVGITAATAGFARRRAPLAEASAKTGEATADLYPRITLTASPALISTALSNLLSSGSENASFGGSLGWNLFDAGKRRAALREANESERQSLLSYQKAVLVALQEVEDALSQLAAESAETITSNNPIRRRRGLRRSPRHNIAPASRR